MFTPIMAPAGSNSYWAGGGRVGVLIEQLHIVTINYDKKKNRTGIRKRKQLPIAKKDQEQI